MSDTHFEVSITDGSTTIDLEIVDGAFTNNTWQQTSPAPTIGSGSGRVDFTLFPGLGLNTHLFDGASGKIICDLTGFGASTPAGASGNGLCNDPIFNGSLGAIRWTVNRVF